MAASQESEGVERAAILLLSLGQDEAAEILKNLGPKEVQKLGHAMAALKQVPRERGCSTVTPKVNPGCGSSPLSGVRA